MTVLNKENYSAEILMNLGKINKESDSKINKENDSNEVFIEIMKVDNGDVFNVSTCVLLIKLVH